ncbi:hypothetical protein Z182_01384, partial [Streptococcus pyogenes ABC020056884]
DSGYNIPSIAKFLIDKEITPVLPYTRPRGKKEARKQVSLPQTEDKVLRITFLGAFHDT